MLERVIYYEATAPVWQLQMILVAGAIILIMLLVWRYGKKLYRLPR